MIKSKSNLIKFTAGIFFALQLISAIAILTCPLPAEAQSQADSVNSLIFTPQISIPGSEFVGQTSTTVGIYNATTGKMDSTLLARYIGAIYNYGLAIAGILATLVLMGAGVIWLTSGGDSGKITQAKELISGSIAGLIILVISWIILNTINPDLVQLRAISTPIVNKLIINKGCCEKGDQAIMVDTQTECNEAGGIYVANSEEYNVTVADGRCLKNDVYCMVQTDCEGNIQFCYDTDASVMPILMKNCNGAETNLWIRRPKVGPGRCSKIKLNQGTSVVSGCAGKEISCMGIKDGTACQESDNGNNVNGYCYDNICYLGSAKVNERCGIQPGAFCSNQQCGKLSNGPYIEDLYEDAGRSCGMIEKSNNIYSSDPMYCCYESSADLPVTNKNSAVWGPSCGNENGTCYLPGAKCPKGYSWDWWGKNCKVGRCCKAD